MYSKCNIEGAAKDGFAFLRKSHGGCKCPPDGYESPKTLVVLRFFEAMKKSGTNAVRAIPLVHKQTLKNHYCSTIISKEKCTTMTPVFYDVNDVRNVLRCKESKAYRVIRECNKELQALGFIIHPGKVSAEYFLTRHGLTKEGIVQ